jgi:hypothetical protein
MSRKNSRNNSIEIFITRRRTASSSSSNSSTGNNECNRSMSIGSIESITMEETDNIDNIDNIYVKSNKKQIVITKKTTRRIRDVYYELELEPSPNPLYLPHLTYTTWNDTLSNAKK